MIDFHAKYTDENGVLTETSFRRIPPDLLNIRIDIPSFEAGPVVDSVAASVNVTYQQAKARFDLTNDGSGLRWNTHPTLHFTGPKVNVKQFLTLDQIEAIKEANNDRQEKLAKYLRQ